MRKSLADAGRLSAGPESAELLYLEWIYKIRAVRSVPSVPSIALRLRLRLRDRWESRKRQIGSVKSRYVQMGVRNGDREGKV